MEKSYETYTSELEEYIANAKRRLSAVLSALEWTEEETLKESTCSGSLTSRKQKEDPGDPPLQETIGSLHTIVIDENKLKDILNSKDVVVPEKFSDIQLNFTREQKLALYEYAIENTGKTSEPELTVSMPSDNLGASDMTFAEIVAKAKKNDKKLKRKYRKSKPTHIEEVRNLVHLQMQALSQYFNPKLPEGTRSCKSSCSDEMLLQRERHKRREPERISKRPKHDRERPRKRRRSYDLVSDYVKSSHSRRHHSEERGSHSKKKSKKHSKSSHKSKSKKHKDHHKSKKH